MVPAKAVTRLLDQFDRSQQPAMAELLPLVYHDLRSLADRLFRNQRREHTLQPTALVHELYLRLASAPDRKWQSREHFFRAAAVAMRCILVNHARDRNRQKRGGGRARVPLEDVVTRYEDRGGDLLLLDDALERLAHRDTMQCQIVELRFFAGLSLAEIAETLGISLRTVESDWVLARAWLRRELGEAAD